MSTTTSLPPTSEQDPNAFHKAKLARLGPQNVPEKVHSTSNAPSRPKDPGHSYAKTQHIAFDFFDQRPTNAPFGYEHYVSLPPSYSHDETRQFPLLLFLHGRGESQTALDSNTSYYTLRHGIPKLVLAYDALKSDPESNTDPSISIPSMSQEKTAKPPGPQHVDKSSKPVPRAICTLVAETLITVTPSLNMAHGYGWSAPIVLALLDEIQDRYRVDPDRIHITGFSMGGHGTWALACLAPERFASATVLCGIGDVETVDKIKDLPQWVVHGEKDEVLSAEGSRQMVKALKRAGATDVRLTLYEDLNHDCWTRAYEDAELWAWMLKQNRSDSQKQKSWTFQNSFFSDCSSEARSHLRQYIYMVVTFTVPSSPIMDSSAPARPRVSPPQQLCVSHQEPGQT